MKRARAAGFTLLELMLSMAIITAMVATLWGTINRTAKTKQQLETAQERLHGVRTALMRITRELEMAYLSREITTEVEKRTMFVVNKQTDVDELRFSWFGRQRMRSDIPDSDTSVVMYYGERDRDKAGVLNLVRRETRRLEYKDPMNIRGESYVICAHVVSLKLQMYDARKREWVDEWSTISASGTQYLPTHVRVSLTVLDERDREVTYTSAARIHMTEFVEYKPNRS